MRVIGRILSLAAMMSLLVLPGLAMAQERVPGAGAPAWQAGSSPRQHHHHKKHSPTTAAAVTEITPTPAPTQPPTSFTLSFPPQLLAFIQGVGQQVAQIFPGFGQWLAQWAGGQMSADAGPSPMPITLSCTGAPSGDGFMGTCSDGMGNSCSGTISSTSGFVGSCDGQQVSGLCIAPDGQPGIMTTAGCKENGAEVALGTPGPSGSSGSSGSSSGSSGSDESSPNPEGSGGGSSSGSPSGSSPDPSDSFSGGGSGSGSSQGAVSQSSSDPSDSFAGGGSGSDSGGEGADHHASPSPHGEHGDTDGDRDDASPAPKPGAVAMVSFFAPSGNADQGSSSSAEGTGTRNNPATFAASKNAYTPGTVIWVPTVHKYFVMREDCANCDSLWNNGHQFAVELSVGNAGANNTFSQQNCAAALSREVGSMSSPMPIKLHPPHNEPVSAQPLFDSSTSVCFDGVIYDNTPGATTGKPASLASPGSGSGSGSGGCQHGSGSSSPTPAPSPELSASPTVAPSEVPTIAPSAAPVEVPTATPTEVPTATPTEVPTAAPTDAPTAAPTDVPTSSATIPPIPPTPGGISPSPTWGFGGSTGTLPTGTSSAFVSLAPYQGYTVGLDFPSITSDTVPVQITDALNNGDVSPALPVDNANPPAQPVLYVSIFNATSGTGTANFGATPTVTVTGNFGSATTCGLDILTSAGWISSGAAGTVTGGALTIPSMPLGIQLPPGQIATAISCK